MVSLARVCRCRRITHYLTIVSAQGHCKDMAKILHTKVLCWKCPLFSILFALFVFGMTAADL